MTDILTEYKALAAAAHCDITTVRKGHSGPLAYSHFAKRRAELVGDYFPMDEAALAKLNEFRALHGETLDKLLAA